ncbi:MAG: Six-hairpin glycosidase-like protein [Monoraphidium minutum]|nr:MAG: Six-hairpin glycosidase-like protein [Monoraphidium minutum]
MDMGLAGHAYKTLAPLASAATDACNAPVPAARGREDFGDVLTLSYLFYEAQQSGKLPEWNRVRADKKCGWRHDAHLDEGKSVGKDLVGGYYDAGDYLKCSHPLAWTLSNLVLSAEEFRDGYQSSGNWDVMLHNVKHMSDWLLKAHLVASDNPAKNKFVGQVSARPDHWYFGRPEHSKVNRVVYTASAESPGADLAAEYAAGFASAATLFRGVGQSAYATKLFKHAKQAFAFAEAFPKNWETPDGVFQAYKTYWPEGYLGQMVWAAAWMCKYDASMCPAAAKYWGECMKINNIKYALGYDWDTVLPGAAALLVSLKVDGVSEEAAGWLEGYVLAKWEDTTSLCPKESYANVCYTEKGLAYYADWGTLRGTANMAFIATLMAKYGQAKDAHACWARSQMAYMLGTSDKNDVSYVIGYGSKQGATRPHHRGAACARSYEGKTTMFNNGTCSGGEKAGGKPCCDVDNFLADRDSPIVLKGALVGGPDQSDAYPNIRNDYKRSEVALDYQAGFTGAAAGLASFQKAGKLSKCGTAAVKRCKKVADYSFCGGVGDMCPPEMAGACKDAAWPDHCCAAGQMCVRKNQYAWMCVGAVPQ